MDISFYFYHWVREDKSPYYVGKGSGDRAWKITKGHYPPKDKSKIVIVAQHLTEHEAFILEKKTIAFYGRKDLGTGILNNRTDGGEGPSGRRMTDETKEKLGKAVSQRLSNNVEREKLAERAKAQWTNPEKRNKLIAGLRNTSEEARINRCNAARLREEKKRLTKMQAVVLSGIESSKTHSFSLKN